MIKTVNHNNMLHWLIENHHTMSVYYDGVLIKRSPEGFAGEFDKPDLVELFKGQLCHTELVTR